MAILETADDKKKPKAYIWPVNLSVDLALTYAIVCFKSQYAPVHSDTPLEMNKYRIKKKFKDKLPIFFKLLLTRLSSKLRLARINRRRS